jgi:DNA polymerase-4
MNQLGIFTGLDLRQQTEVFLRQHFGKAGSHYYAIARAEDHRPVVADRVRKSIGSETTFEQDLSSYEELVNGIAPCIESVWAYCQRTETRGRTVTVKVKFADFQQVTRSRTILASVVDIKTLEYVSLELLNGLLPLAQGVRLLGVSLSNLETEDVAGRQLALIF